MFRNTTSMTNLCYRSSTEIQNNNVWYIMTALLLKCKKNPKLLKHCNRYLHVQQNNLKDFSNYHINNRYKHIYLVPCKEGFDYLNLKLIIRFILFQFLAKSCKVKTSNKFM